MFGTKEETTNGRLSGVNARGFLKQVLTSLFKLYREGPGTYYEPCSCFRLTGSWGCWRHCVQLVQPLTGCLNSLKLLFPVVPTSSWWEAGSLQEDPLYLWHLWLLESSLSCWPRHLLPETEAPFRQEPNRQGVFVFWILPIEIPPQGLLPGMELWPLAFF